jgi:outer membrane receptor for ferrienterochelin and colicin
MKICKTYWKKGKNLFLLFQLILLNFNSYSQSVTFSGYVVEKNTKEKLIAASISLPGINKFTTCNKYGYFSITLPPHIDSIFVEISMIGYETLSEKILLDKNYTSEYILLPESKLLDDLKVYAHTEKVSNSSKISTISIPIKQLKDIPSLMGEKDIIKAIQLLPGVQNGTEGSNGLFVRGGGTDQNLILMDEAKVYNISHLFGFFSIFNGDALKSMEFIKGGFPARYGGRISSVLDVQMKDGSKNGTHGEFGLGLITSRLTLETPIKKDKSSFIISARRTYPDLLLGLIKNPDGSVIKSNFYDINSKINFDLNSNNSFFLSFYSGDDNFFQGDRESGDGKVQYRFGWGNNTGTFRWNHVINQKFFSNLSIIGSKFNYSLNNNIGTYSQGFSSNLKELGLKNDWDFFGYEYHHIRFGFNYSRLHFSPNLTTLEDNGNRISQSLEKIIADDLAIYAEDISEISNKLSVNYGLRLALFEPLNSKLYSFLEPRIALNYSFARNWSMKGAFSKMNQPIQLISNTGLGLSIDAWVPSTNKLPPQNSKQITIGISHDLNKKMSFEIETFYKEMKNIIAFKDGKSLFSTIEIFRDRDFGNKQIIWQEITTKGDGSSKGIEFFLKKPKGKLTGWASYTISKVTNVFEELNNGKPFFPVHDRRHQVSFVANYVINNKITLSSNYVLGSGTPINLPESSYQHFSKNPFTNNPEYSFKEVIEYNNQRNNSRSKYYQGIDLSVQFAKQRKYYKRTWEIGFYNITGQKNIFGYSAETNGLLENEKFYKTKSIKEYSVLLFFPSISNYIKF